MCDIEFVEDLYEHQKEGVELLSKWENETVYGICGGILSYEMGLGKTRTILEIINREKTERLSKGQQCVTTLVVCPLGAVSVWVKQLTEFYPDELTFTVLHPLQCAETSTVVQSELDGYDVVITTYDIVRKQFKIADVRCFVVRANAFAPIESNLYKRSQLNEIHERTGVRYKIVSVSKSIEPDPSHYTPIYSRRWRRIVADESTKFCGDKTAIGYAMIALNADSYFCMTGTPIMNYDSDLYNMFRFLGLLMLRKDWKPERYRSLGLNGRILTKRYEDTDIVLPTASYQVVEVKLSDFERKLYNLIVDKLQDAWSLFKRGDKTFAAPLEMFLRLRQICVCAAVLAVEPAAKLRKKRDIEALKELVSSQDEDASAVQLELDQLEEEFGTDTVSKLFEDEELIAQLRDTENRTSYTKIAKTLELAKPIIERGGKLLIFSSFVQVLNVLKTEFEKYDLKVFQLDGRVAVNKRTDMQKIFNDPTGGYQIFLSSYKAGGMAIDLTAADTVILMEPWWNSATEDQAIARAHRIGQKSNVTIHSLIAIPSFETHLLKVQNRKYLNTKEFLDSHKEKYSKFKNSSIAKSLIESIVYGKI